MNCLVICKGDEGKGYMLATRSIFESRELAEEYAKTIAESREPIVVDCPLGTDMLPFSQAHPVLYAAYSKRIAAREQEV
jgi:hypothetical protein